MASLISPPPATHGVQGSQHPRILHVPDYVSSTGREAIELVAMAGIGLDPWQQLVLTHGLGERADGMWAALEVALTAPRQNGKGNVDEARALAGMFLLDEMLVIHSAHEFPTAEAALERMAIIMESCPDFDRRVKSIKRSHGQEGVYLKGGQAIRYRTRTKGGGRGLSADCVILDEHMHIPEAMLNALFFTLSAMPNPQVWYTGSAVDQLVMQDGVVIARVRERGLKGEDPRLVYAEWSAPFEHPSEVTEDDARDPDVWAAGNPALGRRISVEFVSAEQRSLSPRGFAVERLGVGDWPATDVNPDRKIDDGAWQALADAASKPADPVCFAFDVTPDRSTSAICVAGYRPDGLLHVEVADMRAGTGWVKKRVADLIEKHGPLGVCWAKGSPAAALVAGVEKELEERGLVMGLTAVTAEDHAKACGMLIDAIDDRTLRHMGQTALGVAVKGAQTKKAGESWLWSRTTSAVSIAPLVGCTLALWGLATITPTKPPVDVSRMRIRRL